MAKLKLISMNEDLERFSVLPEHIVHQILSIVPIKDAARTCILSKTWKRLCTSYDIVSSLGYDHNSFALQLLLNNNNNNNNAEESEPKIDEIRDRFMDYADDHLSRVIQQQCPVFKIAVYIAVIDSEFARVDQFMDLLRKVTKVEELSIFVETRDFCWYDDLFEGNIFYDFPYALILACKGLQSLTLQGCKLISNSNVDMFSSLRQLTLNQVLLIGEESLSSIASCCTGLELIEFHCCSYWNTTLKLSKFRKLKKFSMEDNQYGLQSVDITETNLENLYSTSNDLEFLISLAACSNIRVLELHSCSVDRPDLLHDLTTYFPLLEAAKLIDVTVTPSEDPFDSVTAANPHLRKLVLLFNRYIKVLRISCPNLRHFDCSASFEEVYMDCPKLRTYSYYAINQIPRLIVLALPTNIRYVLFSFFVRCVLHTPWFISLRTFLEQIKGCNDVYLHLNISLNMGTEFVLDEFQAVQTSKLNNIHLQVKIAYECDGCAHSNAAATLADGLVWSTQPATLSVSVDLRCYDFVKHLCEKLAEKPHDKSCCDEHQLCNKYWWHNLSDFQVKHRNKDMKQNLTSLVVICQQSHHRGLYGDQLSNADRLPICFEFKWRSIERFTEKFALLVEMAGWIQPRPQPQPQPSSYTTIYSSI